MTLDLSGVVLLAPPGLRAFHIVRHASDAVGGNGGYYLSGR